MAEINPYDRGWSTQQASDTNKQYNEAIRTLATGAPELRKDPITIASLAGANGLDPKEVVKQIRVAKIKAAHQRSLWGNISHFLFDPSQSVQRTVDQLDPFKASNYVDAWHTGVNFANHAGQSIWDLGASTVKGVAGWFGQFAHPSQLLSNTAIAPGHLRGMGPDWLKVFETPFLQGATMAGDVAQWPANTLGYYASKIRSEGYGAALGDAFAPLLLAFATDGIMSRAVGRTVSASEAADMNTLLYADRINQQIAADREFVQGAKDWASMSNDDMHKISLAQNRLRILSPQTIDREIMERFGRSKSAFDQHIYNQLKERYGSHIFTQADIERLAMSKDPFDRELAETYRRIGEKKWDPSDIHRENPLPHAGEYAASNSKWIGDALRVGINGMRRFNKIVGSVPAQVFYMGTAALASEADPELWEKTKMGTVILPNGKTSTVGDEIANLLNSEPGFFHDIIATIFNLDLNWVVDDPLTSMLRIKGLAKGAYGYTGTLGEYFGGIGIRHAGDVRRAYYQYASVRRAVDWMATHTGAEIIERFKNVFPAKLAHDLGKASTPDGIMSLLEEVSQGIEMVFTEMPVMGWWTVFKTALVGELGHKFGTLGGLLEREIGPTLEEAQQVLEQTGIDVLPKSITYQTMNAAGKARVLFRQRLRKQFIERARWLNERTGVETVKAIAVGSVNAIPSIMHRMEEVNVPRLRARAFADQLLAAAADKNWIAYKRAYRSAMYEVITREIAPMMPRAEFEPFMKKIEEFVWALVDDMIGVDGAGLDGWYVANSNENWNLVLRDDGQIRAAGIADSHLGTLYLPESLKLRRLQRQLAVMVTEMTSSEAEKALTSILDTEQHLLELAEKSLTENVEKATRRWQQIYAKRIARGSAAFGNENYFNGFKRAFKHNMERYSAKAMGETMAGLNRAQRIVVVISQMQKDLSVIEQMLAERLSGVEPRADILATQKLPGDVRYNPVYRSTDVASDEEKQLYREVDELEGEREAIRTMMADMKARINESPMSMNEVEQLAELSAATTKLVGEAKQAWVKAFKEKFIARSEGKASLAGIRIAGKRGLRSNREIIADFFQFYINNRYFKPMALTSPAWAARVTTSELLVNTLRLGGFNFFESWVATGIAKQELRLGKEARLPAEERNLLKQVIAGTLLGIDRGLIGMIDDPRKARLVQDAVDLFVANDGHLKMGVHSHRDSVADEAKEDSVVEAAFSIDKSGEVQKGSFRRGEHQRIDASAEGAGTAMHESMIRAANDAVLAPISRFYRTLLQQRGSEIFDANAAAEYNSIYKKAISILEAKKSFRRRNQIIEEEREALINSIDFERASIMEREAMLDALYEAQGDVEKVISDAITKTARAQFEATGRALDRVIKAREQLSSEIERLQDEAAVLSGADKPSVATREYKGSVKAIDDEIKALDKKLKANVKEQQKIMKMLEEHPYAAVIQKLEGARAVAPYKAIRKELIDELTLNIEQMHRDSTARLKELFGEEKVVVPTGSEVQMLGDRFNVFLDGEGNPVPNSEIWQAVMENHPQLWSENEKYASHMPVGMPGVDGYDALARALGIKPRVFANYAVTESGKTAFIEDYDRYKKILRSRKATGTEKSAAERWMHENVSSKKADWRLDAEEVWDRRVALGGREVSAPHGLTISEWFEQAMMMTEHYGALDAAYKALLKGDHKVAFDALKGIDPTMANEMRSAPKLFPDGPSFEDAFAVRGVPLDILLAPGKGETKALSDLSFHLRQRSDLIDSNLFDPKVVPHYTPDEKGLKAFYADFGRAEEILKRYKKRLKEIEHDTDRNAHRARMRELFMEKQRERAERAYPRGWGMEEKIATETYPTVSTDLAVTLRRLYEDNEIGLIRDLRLGEDITFSDIFEFGSPQELEYLARRLGIDTNYFSGLQESGLPGPEITDKLVLNYADVGDIYNAVVKYLGGHERLQNVAMNGRVYASHDLTEVSHLIWRAGGSTDYEVGRYIEQMVAEHEAGRSLTDGPRITVTGIRGHRPFDLNGDEGISRMIFDAFAHEEAYNVFGTYFQELFSTVTGAAAKDNIKLSAARTQLKDILGIDSADELPDAFNNPYQYGFDLQSVLHIAAKLGAKNALDHLDTGLKYSNFVPLDKSFTAEAVAAAAKTLYDEGYDANIHFVQGMPIAIKDYAPRIEAEEIDSMIEHEVFAATIAKAIDAPIRDVGILPVSETEDFKRIFHPAIPYTDTESLFEHWAGTSHLQDWGHTDSVLGVLHRIMTDSLWMTDSDLGRGLFEILSTLPPQTAESVRKLAIYDAITGFGDRHSGNFLFKQDGTVVGIDNDSVMHRLPGEHEDWAAEILHNVLATREEIENIIWSIQSMQLEGIDGLNFERADGWADQIVNVLDNILERDDVLVDSRPAFTGELITMDELYPPAVVEEVKPVAPASDEPEFELVGKHGLKILPPFRGAGTYYTKTPITSVGMLDIIRRLNFDQFQAAAEMRKELGGKLFSDLKGLDALREVKFPKLISDAGKRVRKIDSDTAAESKFRGQMTVFGVTEYILRGSDGTAAGFARAMNKSLKEGREAAEVLLPDGADKFSAKNVQPIIDAIHETWNKMLEKSEGGAAYIAKSKELSELTGFVPPSPAYHPDQLFNPARVGLDDEERYNKIRAFLLGDKAPKSIMEVVAKPEKPREFAKAAPSFAKHSAESTADPIGLISHTEKPMLKLSDIFDSHLPGEQHYPKAIFEQVVQAAMFKRRVESYGSEMIDAVQKAASSRKKIRDISRVRFAPGDGTGLQSRARLTGEVPHELNMLYDDPNNIEALAGLRGTFTSKTMKKVFGIGNVDPIKATAHVKRLESYINTNKQFARVSLSYENGIKVENFVYDPASREGRQKAIDTMKLLCNTADTYKMQLRVESPILTSLEEHSVTEVERRLESWYASFGFSSTRSKPSNELIPGSKYERRDYVTFVRRPSRPGIASLVPESTPEPLSNIPIKQDAKKAKKAKVEEAAEEEESAYSPLVKPSSRHLTFMERELEEGYGDEEEFERAIEQYQEEMDQYLSDLEFYKSNGIDPKTGMKKGSKPKSSEDVDEEDIDSASTPRERRNAEYRALGMSPYWEELDTSIDPALAEEVKWAQRWWTNKVEPFGFEKPTPNRVFQRAMDIERSNVSLQKDRDGYYALQKTLTEKSKEQTLLGRERRKAETRKRNLPAVDEIQERNAAASLKAQDILQAKREKLESMDSTIERQLERRESMRQHALRQANKGREREAQRITAFYDRRLRNAAVGMSGKVKKYANKMGTLNTQIEREVSSMVQRRISELGAASFSGKENIGDLHQQLSDFAYTHLSSLSAEDLARYERSTFPLADPDLTSGDAMTDFANTIAHHLLGITSSSLDGKVFGDLVNQIGSGEIMGAQQAAKWLGNRKKNGLSMPGPFPERRFVTPWQKGSGMGLMNRMSDYAHSKLLGKIVNEFVREPVFLWEYHVQMEKLRPAIARGIMTHDQAVAKASADASINMMKFVHNPQDKLVWENNWRVLAPFYFAKNQALRRAFRMGGDNLAAFEKYLKINLAVTDFVAQVTTDAAQTYNIPGSQLYAAFTNTTVGAALSVFGYDRGYTKKLNFGFDASPSSVTSIVVTGMVPGAFGLIEELVHIPFGINFTVPAKLIYKIAGQKSGTAHAFLTALIGDVGMRSTLWEDLLPNSLLRNAAKGGLGIIMPDSAGSYQSQETWVMTDILDQKALEFYEKAAKEYPTLTSQQLAQYGSKEELWTTIAMFEMSRWSRNPENMQWLQDQANGSTGMMWALKTIASFVLPVAVNIGERFYDRAEFYNMASQRDANGDLIYPTVQLASNAFMLKYPDKMFAMLPHTMSTGNPYPETTNAGDFINNNEVFVKQYPLMAPFMIKSGGDFDSNALAIEMRLNLRKRITVPEFWKQFRVINGDRYFAQLELQYRLNPMNIDRTNAAGVAYLQAFMNAKSYEERFQVATSKVGMGAQLTWEAFRNLDHDARLYAQTQNSVWGSEHYGGRRRELANATYQEFKRMIKDPMFEQTVGPQDAQRYREFLDSIQAYRKAYREFRAANYSTNQLKEAWYSWCTAQAVDPANEKYAGFIYSVLRKVPDPMDDPNDMQNP